MACSPAAPEKASGYRLGLTAKHSSKYMAVANTPWPPRPAATLRPVARRWTRHRHAGRAGLVGAAVEHHRRQCLHGLLRRETKKVTAYDGRETAPAAATNYYLVRQDQGDTTSPTPVLRAAQRPFHRRAGCDAHARPGTQGAAWQAGLERTVRLRHPAVHEWLPDSRPPGAAIASNASSLALDANAMATHFHADGTPRITGEP